MRWWKILDSSTPSIPKVIKFVAVRLRLRTLLDFFVAIASRLSGKLFMHKVFSENFNEVKMDLQLSLEKTWIYETKSSGALGAMWTSVHWWALLIWRGWLL